ncbi:hypothetical protein MUK42_16085 [Musa troglodytarum]|uniref:Uncharacterized protein n=1 Tax=Musa troglodytarum TaxID=320322 RepID=A0A9E7HCU4_9LILI|nr:hypothetical protein MUK42_16085 [Musa troglodytarum]
MEVSMLVLLVLAYGVRVGVDKRYKIWCCIGNQLALHSLACLPRLRDEVVHNAMVEGQEALSSHHRLAPVDDGLDGFLPFLHSPRIGAGLSIHARAVIALGLALRKEIALLLVAAEKIPRFGAIDVSEGYSVAREGRTDDPVGEVVDHEFLRRGKEPVATWNLVDGLHGREEMSEEKGRTEERFEDHEDGGIYIGSSGIGPKRVIMSPCMPIRSDLSTTPGLFHIEAPSAYSSSTAYTTITRDQTCWPSTSLSLRDPASRSPPSVLLAEHWLERPLLSMKYIDLRVDLEFCLMDFRFEDLKEECIYVGSSGVGLWLSVIGHQEGTDVFQAS